MLRRTCSWLAAATLLALFGCQRPPSTIDPTQSLIETRAAWMDAIAAGDLDQIFAFWSDDVVIYPVAEPTLNGIEEVRAYVRRNRQELGRAPRMKPIEIVASASGDLGYIVGTHEWVDREGRVSDPGRYVSMWRKNEQGEWRCFLEIHSPQPPATAAGSDTTVQP